MKLPGRECEPCLWARQENWSQSQTRHALTFHRQTIMINSIKWDWKFKRNYHLSCQAGIAQMYWANRVFFVSADIESSGNHLGTEAIDICGNLNTCEWIFSFVLFKKIKIYYLLRKAGVLGEHVNDLKSSSDNLYYQTNQFAHKSRRKTGK